MIKKISLKILLISALFPLSSCFVHDFFPRKNTGPEEIRIVDLNGNPRPIQRFVPEGNARALAQQRSVQNQPAPIQNNVATNNLSQNNFISQNQAPVNNLPPVDPPVIVQESPKPPATISYNMSGDAAASLGSAQEITKPKIKTTPAKEAKMIFNKKSAESGSFIQIGSFSVKNNAQKTLEKGQIIFKGKVEERNISNKKSYRVLLGPISDNAKVNNILRKAKNNGYADAFIVR
ncbi:MAG: cell division protein FtsN [Myxococcota bacterium]|jgi:cell division protein FtsN